VPATDRKQAIWGRLGDRQLGVAFRIDEKMQGYVADFYCEAAKLVVELDEPAPDNPQQRKAARATDAAFRKQGLIVLRIPQEMGTEDAVNRIDRKLHFLQVPRDTPSPEGDVDSSEAA
jgi:very-short-patch-repair endonuclease